MLSLARPPAAAVVRADSAAALLACRVSPVTDHFGVMHDSDVVACPHSLVL
jgi:hypothetical protein